MELTLSGVQWTACLIYLDDVIMYGKTFDEHLQRLSMVLLQFHQAGLTVEIKQVSFLSDTDDLPWACTDP